MLATLRRFRLLAYLALLASPGVAGGAVQLLHPCPVASAEVGPAHHAAGDMAEHGHTPQAPPSRHEQCHCIGACCPAATVAAPALASGIAARVAPLPAARFLTHDAGPGRLPSEFLPPATAPPFLV